jgi:hypothetical protein
MRYELTGSWYARSQPQRTEELSVVLEYRIERFGLKHVNQLLCCVGFLPVPFATVAYDVHERLLAAEDNRRGSVFKLSAQLHRH